MARLIPRYASGVAAACLLLVVSATGGWPGSERAVPVASTPEAVGPSPLLAGAPIPVAPGAARGVVELEAVSCTGARTCMAIAYARGVPSAFATWNGRAWSVRPVTISRPDPAGTPLLDALSCSSPGACTAVGFSAGDLDPAALRWDGSEWAPEAVPTPAGSTSAELSGVDCPVADRCVAVGSYDAAAPDRPVPFAERWNGQSWRVEHVPRPSAATSGSELDDVSCSAPGSCMAVGSSGTATFAVRLAGSSWTPADPAGTGSGRGALDAVSCPAAARCVAVGHGTQVPVVGANGTASSAPITGGLAELWDGTSWRPLGRGGTEGGHALVSVSCVRPSACTAVGPPGTAEQWGGGHWGRQPLAVPVNAQKGSVAAFGVSCASATCCEAVGSFRPAGRHGGNGTAALAEGWDGRTWRVQPVDA